LARSPLADQLDAGAVERGDELHERIDIAADDAFARLHALDGRHRQAALRSEFALVDAEKGARGAQLCSGDHAGRSMRARDVPDLFNPRILKYQACDMMFLTSVVPHSPCVLIINEASSP
jgi:hypothetical protein